METFDLISPEMEICDIYHSDLAFTQYSISMRDSREKHQKDFSPHHILGNLKLLVKFLRHFNPTVRVHYLRCLIRYELIPILEKIDTDFPDDEEDN